LKKVGKAKARIQRTYGTLRQAFEARGDGWETGKTKRCSHKEKVRVLKGEKTRRKRRDSRPKESLREVRSLSDFWRGEHETKKENKRKSHQNYGS